MFGACINTAAFFNEALDAEVAAAQAFHSSSRSPTPPFATRMTHFISTAGPGVQVESVSPHNRVDVKPTDCFTFAALPIEGIHLYIWS